MSVLALAACISVEIPPPQPGQFANHREYMLHYFKAMFPLSSRVPRDVEDRFWNCGIDSMYEFYTPAELRELDEYARGKPRMSQQELQNMSDEIESRMGGEEGLWNVMRRRCPAEVKAVEQINAQG